MWPYFALIIIPPLVYLLFLSQTKKKEKTARWGISSFFFIWLFLLMFRHESVGVDLENYHFMFDSYSTSSVKDIIYSLGIEKGFSLWNKFCFLINNDFQVFLAFTAIFCVVPIWMFYFKRTENVLFTILLFLIIAPFTMYFSGLRQSMAMAFVFPAFIFARDKRILLFTLTVLLAFTFHQSALIMGLIYPLYHMKLNKMGAALITLITVLVLIGARYFFSFILTFFGERYEERYGTIDDNGAIGMFILFLTLFVYCNIVLDFDKLDKEYKGIRNIMVFVVMLQAFASVNNMIMRINYYFLPLLPILIAKTSTSPRPQYKDITKTATIIISVFFAYRFVMGVYNGTIYNTDILQTYPWTPCWK